MAHLLCQSSMPLFPTLTRLFPLISLFPSAISSPLPMNTLSSISLTPVALHLPSNISWTLPPLMATVRLVGLLAPF